MPLKILTFFSAVDAQLEDLLKQRKLLQPRREFTSELQSMTEVEYNTSGALGWDRKIHPEDHRLASQGLSSDDKVIATDGFFYLTLTNNDFFSLLSTHDIVFG